MVVGIDIDGVLRDLHTTLVQQYKVDYPEHWVRPISEWKNYNISEYFEMGDKLFHYWFTERAYLIYLNSLPFSGVGLLGEFTRKGNTIHIVTSQPNYQTRLFTTMWIYNNFLGSYDLHFVADKSVVDCDVFLDDCPDHVEQIRRKGKPVVIMDRPWNKKIIGTRVDSLHSFFNLIERGYGNEQN